MTTEAKRFPNWAIAIACLLPLLGFWTYGLFDLDEGFYAAVVADMMRRGDWITPTLNGIPWFEKPILAYWLAIPSIQVFGQDFGPRLPSVVCTLLTTWHLFLWVRRTFDERVATLTALLYSTNLLVVGIGRMMMTDAPLVLCLTVAATGVYDVSAESNASLKKWIGIGLAVGLGILAKGPVALILFGGVMIACSVVHKPFRCVWKSAWPLGFLVSLLVLATWYVPCYQANGQAFVQKFLIEQNIGRFAGGDKAHSVPFWAHPIYFPAVILLSFLPWIFFGVRNLKAETKDDFRSKFLWVWFLVPAIFFTISGTKLPHYILPAIGPFSILLALALTRARPQFSWQPVLGGWSVAVFVLAQTIMQADWKNRMQEVQSLAKYGSSQTEQFTVYKLGGSGDKSVSLELRPTSHPSIGFYAKKAFVETDDISKINSGIVLTRKEVLETDSALKNLKLSPVATPGIEQKEFVLLLVGR